MPTKTNTSIDERSVTSNTSEATETKGALPGYLVKSLAEIIEGNGGVLTFGGRTSQKLSILLDKADNKIFGKRGDNIRLRIQKKVWQWQQLQEKGTYETKVLKLLGVPSFESRMKEGAQATRQKPSKQQKPLSPASSKSSSESSEDESSESGSMPLKQSKKAPSQQFSSPPAKHITVRDQQSVPLTPLTPAIFSPVVVDNKKWQVFQKILVSQQLVF